MMQDKPMFWTVFKADLLFTLCSITVSILITLTIALWRKRKRMKASPSLQKQEGPQAFIIGGRNPKPAHCPLCGQGWPLPGPIVPTQPPTVPPTS